jgi:hypothetical protein
LDAEVKQIKKKKKKMFKRFWNSVKSYGKKAIGYIKGMNGHRMADAAIVAIESLFPGAGMMAAPASRYLGNKVNSLLDYLSQEEQVQQGGVRKPASLPRYISMSTYPLNNQIKKVKQ